MYTGVKVNYSDDIEETMHLIHDKKDKRKKKNALIMQRIIGLCLILLGILSAIILNGDITIMCFCMLMGMVIVFSRRIWII